MVEAALPLVMVEVELRFFFPYCPSKDTEDREDRLRTPVTRFGMFWHPGSGRFELAVTFFPESPPKPVWNP